MRLFLATLWGALFGAGLALSGMTQPARVLGFLDVFGAWDPALLLVMAGALAVFGALRPLVVRARRAQVSGLGAPASSRIDGKLVAGAAIFGVGWGLAGYCPGPILAAGASGSWAGAVVLVGLILGLTFAKYLERFGQAPKVSDACAGDPESASA